ncbi:MAG: hypothetical protein ABSE40_08435 [Candidatus Sulfotelmatobacter sp.]
MSSTREYHVGVRRSVPAPVALFSLVAVPVVLVFFLVEGAWAQTNNGTSSASPSSAAGHTVSAPSSGLAPAPAVHVPLPPHNGGGSGGNGSGHGSHGGNSSSPGAGSGQGDHGHHHYVQYAPTVLYAVPVPYAVDIAETDNYADPNADADDNDPNYQGGPTVFDRRGSGEDSYVPPVEDVSEPYDAQAGNYDRAALEPQDPTVLVFKDGHTTEVGNYAIVGAMLFDLTPGHPRRIALADLDVKATYKQNDDRGVIFQLPTAMQAN